jgi:single-strand DNA-binding protein
MAGSMNRVTLIGHLGKDPESRSTQAGTSIVSFSIATSESWTDRASGERKERTEWHRIVCFNEKLGEIAEKYTKKGSYVLLEGSLQSRKWTDQSGVEKYVTEIVLNQYNSKLLLLDKRSDESANNHGGGSASEPRRERATAGAGAGGRAAGNAQWEPRGGGDLDDEIPF